MAPLEPWEKAIVDYVNFSQTDHGEIACEACHNGNTAVENKEEAHEGLISRPSEGDAPACQECHEEEVAAHGNSLHSSQEGYWTVLEARGADRNHPEMQEMFGNHCSSCHTSCGDCHVSQPSTVGGGLLDGHMFTNNPPMTRTCTACHGSRVGNEYMGKNEGLMADLHFRQERMTCIDCHPGTELHGIAVNDTDSPPPTHRYDGTEGPRCEDCHESAMLGEDGIKMHRIHEVNQLACQVCHSTTYVNCDSCHVAVSEASGNAYFETADTYFTFLIGRNPIQSAERPYQYVPVRHVPIDPESFAFYGDDLLPNFNDQPTWRYATPHNIQKETPQNISCNDCHGNPAIFLTSDKVSPEELEANQDVIVDTVPDEQ